MPFSLYYIALFIWSPICLFKTLSLPISLAISFSLLSVFSSLSLSLLYFPSSHVFTLCCHPAPCVPPPLSPPTLSYPSPVSLKSTSVSLPSVSFPLCLSSSLSHWMPDLLLSEGWMEATILQIGSSL